MTHDFVRQTSRTPKAKALLIVLLIGFIVSLAIVASNFASANVAGYKSMLDYLGAEIYSASPLGLLISGFLGALFFIPSTIDFTYPLGLLQGHSIILLFLAAFFGTFMGTYVNYLLGDRLNGVLRHFVSLKKLYETKRLVNKYGGWALFTFALTPLPMSLMTFAVAVTRYNIYRMFVWSFLGFGLKLIILSFLPVDFINQFFS